MPEYISVYSSLAVPDIDTARSFYRDVVGLAVAEEPMGQISIDLRGGSRVLVYPKPDHVPATYTVLNLVVSDIDAAVDELVSRGIEFERYDGFDQDARGIARGIARDEGPDIAWFADQAGNIISVMQTAD